ncbi:MAG: aminoacyl-tRNA hydrolase [Chloroflexota bacterium]|nr:aminoacyl-tRNA hydrolase [Chloroflexota bacterium]
MKVIIGLGNPGPAYQSTRHNVGWWVIERLAQRWHAGPPRARHRAAVATATFRGAAVLLVRPLTYMNESGAAVRTLVAAENVVGSDLLVVYDELALPLGQLRVRPRGGAGGHKGLESVLGALGTQDVPRLRIGIGPPPVGVDRVSYVLGEFAADERPVIEDAADRAAEAVECVLRDGLIAALDR